MATRTCIGARDYWTVNGDINFGFIPGGLTPAAGESTPVRLQRGDPNAQWGHDHIWIDHSRWVESTGLSIPHLLLTKLAQPGNVFTTEVDTKFKIAINLGPNALLILRYTPGSQLIFRCHVAVLQKFSNRRKTPR